MVIQMIEVVGRNEMKKYAIDIRIAADRLAGALILSNNETIDAILNKIIADDDNTDHRMLSYLDDFDLEPRKIYVDALIESSRKMVYDYTVSVRYSVNSFIYHYQYDTLIMAMQYLNVIETATILRDSYEGRTTDREYFFVRRSILMSLFDGGLLSGSVALQEPALLSSFPNLISDNIKSFQLQKNALKSLSDIDIDDTAMETFETKFQPKPVNKIYLGFVLVPKGR
jgi:hypothetical protein